VVPAQILGVGLNYRHHAKESNLKVPELPVLFVKGVNTLQNPGDPILLPTHLPSTEVDYECELAVVIGRACKNVSRERALDYVLGYTCANDVSARDWQIRKGSGQWCRGKFFDTFCPLGPRLVTGDELPAGPNALKIATRVNGETLQDWTTSDMIFDIPTLIEFLSGSTTLPCPARSSSPARRMASAWRARRRAGWWPVMRSRSTSSASAASRIRCASSPPPATRRPAPALMSRFPGVDVFQAIPCALGEGVCWHPGRRTVWWIDILGPHVYEASPDGERVRRWPCDQLIGAVAPTRSGGVLAALRDGFIDSIPKPAQPAGSPRHRSTTRVCFVSTMRRWIRPGVSGPARSPSTDGSTSPGCTGLTVTAAPR
jgi:hypothetical protein